MLSQPAGPAELRVTAEPSGRNLFPFERQPHVPAELEAQIHAYPLDQLCAARTARQKALVLCERKGTQADAEFMLPIPHLRTNYRISCERSPALDAKTRALRLRQLEPVSNELFDRHRHVEVAEQDGAQPLGIAHAPHQPMR